MSMKRTIRCGKETDRDERQDLNKLDNGQIDKALDRVKNMCTWFLCKSLSKTREAWVWSKTEARNKV